MQSFDEIDMISIMIETILIDRLDHHKQKKQIVKMIEEMDGMKNDAKYQMKIEVGILEKNHRNSVFKVKNMLQRYFKRNKVELEQYQVQVVIFLRDESHLKGFQNKKILEKWIFKKQTLRKFKKKFMKINYKLNDLILTILKALNSQKISQSLPNGSIYNNNSHVKKDYQLIIKSQTSLHSREKIYLLHHSGKEVDLKVYRHHFSIIQYGNFWEKRVQIGQFKQIIVGCYFAAKNQVTKNEHRLQIQTQFEPLQNNIAHRKLSLEQRTEQSTSSLKLNFSCKLSKQFFSDNSSQHNLSNFGQKRRRRIHSIYESKDQEIGVWVLSPRKLSQQDSPKIKNFEQKTYKFSVDVHNGIMQEQMMQQLCLQPDCFFDDDHKGSESSGQFQLLDFQRQSSDAVVEQSKSNCKLKAAKLSLQKIQFQIFGFLDQIDNVMIVLQ